MVYRAGQNSRSTITPAIRGLRAVPDSIEIAWQTTSAPCRGRARVGPSINVDPSVISAINLSGSKMETLYWVAGFVLLVAVGGLLAGQAGLLNGKEPTDLGVQSGRLKGLSSTNNCVSSQASLYPDHPQRRHAEIAPLGLRGDGPATLARITEVVQQMPGSQIVVEQRDYVRARFTSQWLKFVDDTEFWFDPAAQVIQVRSASRVGREDFGVNRRRIEAIRSSMTAA